ncbi:hypothetical protein GO986_17440 [Deinococcus sp. HMF7620]|uniref:Uncharacterized protein n=1 Tax=Deinococcus arboris TaxID=2682977 RepID=A0A7C9M8E8_9DEIO|nr:hypothetical protein [Deinococcus arboris]MVN88525.1 hypothetical protein [Deinococcus arboris]
MVQVPTTTPHFNESRLFGPTAARLLMHVSVQISEAALKHDKIFDGLRAAGFTSGGVEQCGDRLTISGTWPSDVGSGIEALAGLAADLGHVRLVGRTPVGDAASNLVWRKYRVTITEGGWIHGPICHTQAEMRRLVKEVEARGDRVEVEERWLDDQGAGPTDGARRVSAPRAASAPSE